MKIKLKQLLTEARFKLSKEDLKYIKKHFVSNLQDELESIATSYVEDNDLDDDELSKLMKPINKDRDVFDFIEDWMEQDKSTVEDVEDDSNKWEYLVQDAKDSFGLAN